MSGLFFILAIICSSTALIISILGMAKKIASRKAWLIWAVTLSLYAVFLILALILRG